MPKSHRSTIKFRYVPSVCFLIPKFPEINLEELADERLIMRRRVWIPLIEGILWSVLLLPTALFLPIEDPQSFAYQLHGKTVYRWVSLVRANGVSILWVVTIPLVISLMVACLVILQYNFGWKIAGWAAQVMAIVLLIGAFVGTITFLVGIFIVPAGVLLLVTSNNLRRIQLSQGPLSRLKYHKVSASKCSHVNERTAKFCGTCGNRL